MQTSYFPPRPLNTDKSVLKPAKEYKKEVLKVTGAIIFFFIVYLCLLVLAVALAAIVSFVGIELIAAKPMFITLMLGLGLMGCGFLVLYFLIKFIFKIKKLDTSGFVEVSEEEHPDIVSFIRQLSKETQTRFPRRIYLTTEVNASVFYDSSFLSMFLPVRKNLLIGLGLVNSVNMSEFKAVIAHEFGHFSQQSMRLGSYVFNVNKIIYNMLFDNDDYKKALDSWASASGYFALFANLTIRIIVPIQWILKKVYIVVNKSNLSLSRQMEHNADAVSAFVAGPDHLITALKRLEISGYCYQTLLNVFNKWISENIKPVNLFECHSEIMKHYAALNDIRVINGLPLANESDNEIKSRLIIKDQWASHPATSERESYLKALNFASRKAVEESPWILFNAPEDLQQVMTDMLFLNIKFKDEVKPMDLSFFREKYYAEFDLHTYNKKYKGYYDNRRLIAINMDALTPTVNHSSLEELLTKENCAIPKKLAIIKSEKQVLLAIKSKQYKIKTFDFDGKKCNANDIPHLLEQIENEERVLQEKVNATDKEIMMFAISKSNEADQNNINDLYKHYYTVAGEADLFEKRYTDIATAIGPVYTKRQSYANARKIINEVKLTEKEISVQIRGMIDEAKENAYLEKTQLDKIESYLGLNMEYYNGTEFSNHQLNVFNEAMNLCLNLIHEREFRVKKELLEKQIEMTGN